MLIAAVGNAFTRTVLVVECVAPLESSTRTPTVLLPDVGNERETVAPLPSLNWPLPSRSQSVLTIVPFPSGRWTSRRS